VARVDRREEAHVGVTEVGHRVGRHVGDALAEHQVEHEQVVRHLALEAERLREVGRRGERARVAGQGDVERQVAAVNGARGRVAEQLPRPELLEEPAGHHSASRNGYVNEVGAPSKAGNRAFLTAFATQAPVGPFLSVDTSDTLPDGSTVNRAVTVPWYCSTE